MLKRYPEIDLLRTIAILGMVVYHTAFDLSVFYGWEIAVFSGGWKLLARLTAILFLLLVGASFALSYEKTINHVGQERSCPTWFILKKYFVRGFILFSWGILISIVTFVVNPETYVRFGILHMIGLSTLLLPFLAPLRSGNFILGIMLTALGPTIGQLHADTSFLLPLGISPRFFSSVDYFPLIPWLGVILIGMSAGQMFYTGNLRWRPGSFDAVPLFLSWPGRRALWIYLLHQPVLIVLLSLFLVSRL
ncbi:MAG: heparan-alpha-glucosaminide N-acetyltransferase [Patescibacteria group bacterium]